MTQVLDALADQHRRPDRILLTGLDPADDEVREALEHPVAAAGTLVEARPPLPTERGSEPPLHAVVADAVGHREDDEDGRDEDAAGTWIWFLHDDSLPEPGALAELLGAAAASSGVGIVGPKLVELDDPRRLVSFGQTVSRSGRPAGGGVRGQLDQGQFDERRDILGVPVAGMLVRAEVLTDVGGLDPSFADGVAGLDLSWRSHLAGHRVVLAPGAVVRQGAPGLGLSRPLLTRRRTRQLAIARGSFWWAPVRSVVVLLTSLVAGLALLLVKRPSAAAGELADVGAVLAPWRGLAARWRFRRRRRVRRRDLSGLFESRRGAWDGTSDAVHDALAPRTTAARAGSAVETGPVSDEAESLDDQRDRTLWSWPLVTAVLLAVLAAVVRWREHWTGLTGSARGVVGGEVSRVGADAAALWHSWWDGWHGAGLGHAAPAEPWLLPVAGLSWLVEHLPGVDPGGSPAALATAWLLFLAVPASAVSAYLAAGAVTGSRWVRAAAGLVWAVLPPLGAAVAEGRVGPAVVHVVAPFIVMGIVVATGRDDGARRTAVTFGAVLAVALAATFVPAVLAVSTVAGLLVLLLGPGWGRLRGLALAALPWLLLGPWLRALGEDPRLLLGGAGATGTQPDVEPWQLLLLHPAGAVTPWLWWTVPLLLLGVLGAVRTGTRGRQAGLLLATGLLGVAGALAAPRLLAGELPAGYTEAGSPVTAWPGTFLSLAGAGILLAAAAAVDRLGSGPGSAWRRPLVAVVASVAVVAVLAIGAWTAWAGLGPALAVADRAHPAVVTEQAGGAEASRLLELVPAAGTLDYRLVGDEPGPWLRDRVRELSAVASPAAGPGEEALAVAVRLLAGHQDVPGVGDDPAGGLQERLHTLAVGYVGLRAAESDPLAERLDAVPGLTRLGGGESGLALWRVAALGEEADPLVAPARARVLDAEGHPVAPVLTDRPHGGTSGYLLGELPEASVLAVSQGDGWSEHATVTLDGETLKRSGSAWPPTYALPGPGEVRIEVRPTDRTWHLATGGVALLVLFLALPLGGGRRRSPR